MSESHKRYQELSISRKVRLWLSVTINKLRCRYYNLLGIEVGEGTVVSRGAWIDCYRGKVVIGNGCRVTNGAKILSHDQTLSRIYGCDPDLDVKGRTVLEDNVFIGMNSVVLPNVTIGRNSIVGAGTVVSDNVPPDVVVVGNPMRIVKKYDKELGKWASVASDSSSKD